MLFIQDDIPEFIYCWFCNQPVEKSVGSLYYLHHCPASSMKPAVSYYILSCSSGENKRYYIGMLDIIVNHIRLSHYFLSNKSILKSLNEQRGRYLGWNILSEIDSDDLLNQSLNLLLKKMEIYTLFS